MSRIDILYDRIKKEIYRDHESVYEFFRRLRKCHCLSAINAAIEINIDYNHLNNFERNGSNLEIIDKLVDYYIPFMDVEEYRNVVCKKISKLIRSELERNLIHYKKVEIINNIEKKYKK